MNQVLVENKHVDTFKIFLAKYTHNQLSQVKVFNSLMMMMMMMMYKLMECLYKNYNSSSKKTIIYIVT